MKTPLTPKEQELMNKMIEDTIKYASWPQILRMLWWDLFRHKKRNKLVECMLRGMSFYAAYKEAKTF